MDLKDHAKRARQKCECNHERNQHRSGPCYWCPCTGFTLAPVQLPLPGIDPGGAGCAQPGDPVA
jgi:hypothetical protein